MGTSETDNGGPGGDLAGPGAALPGRRMPRVLRQFLATESAGGLVLLVAAVVALVWANSPWHGSYEALWHTELSVGVGRFVLVEDLRHWVNDGLMALFFFVVGLEIKRELARPPRAPGGGHARHRRPRWHGGPCPALPPGDRRRRRAKGWGIPMATDIAFAIGVVALLGSRVPASLKLFLLTLAIVDDIGAIVVIALFYATDIQPVFIATAVGIVVVMLVCGGRASCGRRPMSCSAWSVAGDTGIGCPCHHRRGGPRAVGTGPALSPAAVTRQWARDLSDDPGPAELAVMNRLARTTVSPAERLEHLLHPWTSFAVVPLFAVANAGVVIKADSFDASATVGVTAGVVLGLVVGKVVGISAATWLAVRFGLGRLPEGATWAMVVGIAAIGGIGFTVSLFIAELAFEPGAIQDAAKLGVLGASTVAALLGAALLARACRGNSHG